MRICLLSHSLARGLLSSIWDPRARRRTLGGVHSRDDTDVFGHVEHHPLFLLIEIYNRLCVLTSGHRRQDLEGIGSEKED